MWNETFIFILCIIVLHKGKRLYRDTIPRKCRWLLTAVKWPWIKSCHSLGSFGWNWKGLTIIQSMCVKRTKNIHVVFFQSVFTCLPTIYLQSFIKLELYFRYIHGYQALQNLRLFHPLHSVSSLLATQTLNWEPFLLIKMRYVDLKNYTHSFYI